MLAKATSVLSVLVHEYRDHLVRQGHEVSRLQIIQPGETAPLYSDLWDLTDRELIEARAAPPATSSAWPSVS